MNTNNKCIYTPLIGKGENVIACLKKNNIYVYYGNLQVLKLISCIQEIPDSV